jgi:hypothetical protein
MLASFYISIKKIMNSIGGPTTQEFVLPPIKIKGKKKYEKYKEKYDVSYDHVVSNNDYCFSDS